MSLVDTHCHIHETIAASSDDDTTQSLWAKLDDADLDSIIQRAKAAGVTKMICVGTTLPDSQRAVEAVRAHPHLYASIGLHPHEGAVYASNHHALQQFRSLADKPKVIAIGECGLDYFYNQPEVFDDQKRLLRFQLDLAVERNLPVIFHVRSGQSRSAFDDFWPILDKYDGKIRGVLHSFTDTKANMEAAIERGLYIGINGIATFNKDEGLIETHKTVPLERLLLETDAPYLTPRPHRGTICEPKHVRVTAEFLANLRNISFSEIAKISTQNAHDLFGLE